VRCAPHTAQRHSGGDELALGRGEVWRGLQDGGEERDVVLNAGGRAQPQPSGAEWHRELLRKESVGQFVTANPVFVAHGIGNDLVPARERRRRGSGRAGDASVKVGARQTAHARDAVCGGRGDERVRERAEERGVFVDLPVQPLALQHVVGGDQSSQHVHPSRDQSEAAPVTLGAQGWRRRAG
jgi:hypothetical protein